MNCGSKSGLESRGSVCPSDNFCRSLQSTRQLTEVCHTFNSEDNKRLHKSSAQTDFSGKWLRVDAHRLLIGYVLEREIWTCVECFVWRHSTILVNICRNFTSIWIVYSNVRLKERKSKFAFLLDLLPGFSKLITLFLESSPILYRQLELPDVLELHRSWQSF